jgi:hypothetical protein
LCTVVPFWRLVSDSWLERITAVLVDVVVSHPTCPSHRQAASRQIFAAADAAVKRKTSSQARHAPLLAARKRAHEVADDFCAFSVETCGGLHKTVVRVISCRSPSRRTADSARRRSSSCRSSSGTRGSMPPSRRPRYCVVSCMRRSLAWFSTEMGESCTRRG